MAVLVEGTNVCRCQQFLGGREISGGVFGFGCNQRLFSAIRLQVLWDEHHPAAGSFPSRPEVLDPAQWLPLGLQVQLAAGDHFE
jgi:hypothetical protein